MSETKMSKNSEIIGGLSGTFFKEGRGEMKFREKIERENLEDIGKKVEKVSTSIDSSKKPSNLQRVLKVLAPVPAIPLILSMAACEEVPVLEEQIVEKQVIEGLRYDERSNTFFAQEVNPYNLEIGEKAGVFIKDAVEINGVMESFIGLRPEVIKVLQKKIMEEEKEFRYAFPIDLELAKGIKIKEMELVRLDDVYKSTGVFWDNNNSCLEVSNIPVGTKIYSPVKTPYFLIYDNNWGGNDPSKSSNYALHFEIFTSEMHKDLLFKNEKFDVADLQIGGLGLSLLPPGIEKNIAEDSHSFFTGTKIEKPIAEVVSEEHRSIAIDYFIYQLKDKDNKAELYEIELSNISKVAEVGLAGLLKIEEVPVFISP